MPLSTAKDRLIGSASGDRNAVGYILASAASSADMDIATEEIDDLMRQRHRVMRDEDKGFMVATSVHL